MLGPAFQLEKHSENKELGLVTYTRTIVCIQAAVILVALCLACDLRMIQGQSAARIWNITKFKKFSWLPLTLVHSS